MKGRKLLLVLLLVIPALLIGQVRINEVLYSTANDQIELKNFGITVVDVSNMWFCSLFVYDQIKNLTIVSGSLNIPPSGILALSGTILNNNAADLGFYNDILGNTTNFENSSFMVDFVQWGSANNGRESVAVSKGIWPDNGFVATVPAGHSIEYRGSENGPDQWANQTNPTIGAENGVITEVDDESTPIPLQFSLAQNYPNPFNPSTVISYTIPLSANLVIARLEIYNVLGRKMRSLINTPQPAGFHNISWDGRNDAGKLLPSGVYIYRLSAGNFVQMRKMLLVR